MAVTEAEGSTAAEPVPVIGMEARIALPSMRTGGLAPPGMTRACRPMSSEVVDETVLVAKVMLRPEPAAVPKGRTGATQGSASVPVPVTVGVLDTQQSDEMAKPGTTGAVAPPCSSEANHVLRAAGFDELGERELRNAGVAEAKQLEQVSGHGACFAGRCREPA